MTYMAPVTA